MTAVGPDAPSPELPDRDLIAATAHAIAPYVRRTPVVQAEWASGRTATLKLELLQHTGSFKPRGAFASVLAAPSRPRLLVAASGGNHGLAVAYVGRTLGIPTEVFVPETAPSVKVAGIRRQGATVQLVGASYAEAHEASVARAAETGGFEVHAYDSLHALAGQGTVGLELEEQVSGPDGVDTVLVAVGGAGLIGGIAAWWAGRARIVAVEPQTAPTLHAALAAGHPVDVEVSGLASDALGARRVGRRGFASAVAASTSSVLVTGEDIASAREWLWRELRVAAEPGGATALAALLSGAHVPVEGERVAVIICGGNADPGDLPLD
jgi:threonine dehydratase